MNEPFLLGSGLLDGAPRLFLSISIFCRIASGGARPHLVPVEQFHRNPCMCQEDVMSGGMDLAGWESGPSPS